MKEYSSDFIRRAEVLARVYNGEILSKSDIADEYKVAEITINRDISELRKYGIQIYSKKGKLVILEEPEAVVLQKITADYLPVSMNSNIFFKQIKLLSKANNHNYFPVLILLAKAINEKSIVEFKYQRLSDNLINDYKVIPLQLLSNEFNWILHGNKLGEDILKSFFLSRISSIKLTNKKAKDSKVPVSTDISYKVVLRFNPSVKEEIKSKIWFEDFEIVNDEHGYFILSTNQPISNRLASWCISWWDKIEVIEPVELRQFIKRMMSAFNTKNQITE